MATYSAPAPNPEANSPQPHSPGPHRPGTSIPQRPGSSHLARG